MSSLPTVRLDPSRARTWLNEPNRHDPAETNAARCGVFVDEDGTCEFGYPSPDLLACVDDLVGEASAAGLFGDRVELQTYLTADHDGTTDGVVLLVSVKRPDGGPPLRLASYHLEHHDLVWDTAQSGLDAAVGVLRAAASHADDVLRRAGAALGVLGPVREIPACAAGAGQATHVSCDTCGDLKWLVTAPDGDDTRAWIERCDDCTGAGDTTDEDAAGRAAEQLAATVATAHPHGDTHAGPRPYLAGLTFCEATARATALRRDH
jgi:hypothetical protein